MTHEIKTLIATLDGFPWPILPPQHSRFLHHHNQLSSLLISAQNLQNMPLKDLISQSYNAIVLSDVSSTGESVAERNLLLNAFRIMVTRLDHSCRSYETILSLVELREILLTCARNWRNFASSELR